jgi:hypothetical protein
LGVSKTAYPLLQKLIDPSDWQLIFPSSYYFSRTPRHENSYEVVNENTGQQIAQGGDFENRNTYSTSLLLESTFSKYSSAIKRTHDMR